MMEFLITSEHVEEENLATFAIGKEETPENCRAQCLVNKNCQGYAYNVVTKTCKLFGYMNETPDVNHNDPYQSK